MKELTRQQLDIYFRQIRGRYPRLAVLAIPWIFSTMWADPLNPSPDRVRSLPILMAIVFRIPWLALRALLLSGRIFWLRLLFWRSLRYHRSQRYDGLAKSWAFSKKDTDPNKDFYLGDFSRQLKSRGISVLTLSDSQLPELSILSPWVVFQMVVLQCQTSVFLFYESFRERDKILRGLIGLAGRDCLRYMTLRNGLFYWIGRRAIRQWKPRFFVMLYEGNGWEKCLSLGIRAADPSCKIIGYQHTVIMPHAYELQKPSNSVAGMEPPELILSTGPRSIQFLKPGHQKFKTVFLPFGTFRCDLAEKNGIEPRPDIKTLLVLPEGIVSEMIFLFNTAIDLAQCLPGYQILFRCHPAVPFEKIRSCLKADLVERPNVKLSTEEKIENDFLASSMLLYRGSSASLYAILAGLKPIYLSRYRGEESIDPLFDLHHWREQVDSVSDLVKRVEAYSENPGLNIAESWQRACQFAREYVQPVQSKSYDRLLETLQ